MKIGVIGIGEMGGALARKCSEQGHDVSVANSRGAEAVLAFAADIGARATDIRGAVDGAEVVLLAIPFPAAAKLPTDLFDRAADDVVIIDVSNYFPGIRDPHLVEIDVGMPESIWVSRQLGRPIFKAFNSLLFYTLAELGTPEGTQGRLAIPVAGDDARGKQIVMRLITEFGFDPVDGGSLAQSWRQGPAYACLLLRLRCRQDPPCPCCGSPGQSAENPRQ
ncbi:NAD(P)-binding domain-containing protein [Aminobacter sp. DSM 101952]|uniref:NADPH-dependent F420 reductase n=1 Tax=Aminobacter sp. DSM 101952 TaxID=2735891 RepID=UPI000A48F532|nr:NAD(P)-binding domain-containing protein [Aminobacter sp. DSM 101952]